MTISELHRTANELLGTGEVHKAREIFIRICTLAPADMQAWHMRSAISGMLGDFQDAAACSEQAISINPNVAAVYTNYGNSLMELSRHNEALDAFKNSIALDESNIDTHDNLGTVYQLLGDNKQAESCYKKAISLSAGISKAHNNLVSLLFNTSQQKASIRLCDEILTLDSHNETAYTTLCNCLLNPDTFEDALEVIQTKTTGFDDFSRLLYGAARILRKQGSDKAVEKLLSAVIQHYSTDRRLNMLLATSLVSSNNFARAATVLQTLEGLDVSIPELRHISDLWMDISEYDHSEECLIELNKRLPDELWPEIKLARINITRGLHGNAQKQIETLLGRHPESAELLVELGHIHHLLGNTLDAIGYLQQAIDIEPENALFHSNMGILHKDDHKYDEALTCFKEASRLKPNNLQIRCNIASTYSSLYQHGKAIELFDLIIDKAPSNEAALTGKSIAVERIGDKELAFQLVAPLVEAGSTNIDTLNAYARASTVMGMGKDAIGRLESAIEKSQISPHDRMSAFFNLGYLHDNSGNYDRAFSCYKAGNDLAMDTFQREEHKEYIDILVNAFSHNRMLSSPKSTAISEKPIFIVGMPRSGTSLVEQILSAHPDIYGAGELPHIRNIASSITGLTGSQKVFPLNLDELSTDILNQLSSLYLKKVEHDANNERRITDKMPANFLYIGLIALLFPNASIIHCHRNPIDTCLSCYFQQFKESQYFSHQLSDAAFYYNNYRRLMEHWKSVINIPILDIAYEDMIAAQEEKSRELIDFVGLDWHPDCLDFHKTGRKVITASYDQVRKPIYKSSAGRWKNYEAHLTDLIENLDYQ